MTIAKGIQGNTGQWWITSSQHVPTIDIIVWALGYFLLVIFIQLFLENQLNEE